VADSEGRRAKATKKTNGSPKRENIGFSKKTTKKIIKSPVIIVFVILFAAGVALGFFITDKNVGFSPLMMKVNGVTAEENDYIEIDLSAIRETIVKEDGTPVTAEDVAAAVNFYDAGVSAYFFGNSLADKISKKLYFREDLSHDAEETTTIDFTKPGVYYIEYTCDHFAFGNKKIIKTVFVSGVEIDG